MVSVEAGQKGRFVVLDGLRGIAALVVITDHVASPMLETLLPGRYLAVDFFFVLSGFVLAHVYGERLARGMSFAALMRARFIRLYPLYLIGLAAGGALAFLQVVKGWNDATLTQVAVSGLFAFFFIPCPPSLSVWHDAPYSLNPPAWSLFFELFVNAIFAGLGRRLTPKVCMAFMGLGAVALVPTALHFGQLDGGFAWSNFVAGFPRVIFGFFAGVFLYQTKLYQRLPALPAWAAFAALLAVFMAPAGDLRPIYDLFAVLILFPALVALSANSVGWSPLMRASAIVGMLSYGVYILHVPLWGWLQPLLERFGLGLPGVAAVALTAVTAMLATAVLDAFFDRPVRKWLTRIFEKPAPSRSIGAA